MGSLFTWIPIYEELASELSNWEDKQAELIHFLTELSERGFFNHPI